MEKADFAVNKDSKVLASITLSVDGEEKHKEEKQDPQRRNGTRGAGVVDEVHEESPRPRSYPKKLPANTK